MYETASIILCLGPALVGALAAHRGRRRAAAAFSAAGGPLPVIEGLASSWTALSRWVWAPVLVGLAGAALTLRFGFDPAGFMGPGSPRTAVAAALGVGAGCLCSGLGLAMTYNSMSAHAGLWVRDPTVVNSITTFPVPAMAAGLAFALFALTVSVESRVAPPLLWGLPQVRALAPLLAGFAAYGLALRLALNPRAARPVRTRYLLAGAADLAIILGAVIALSMILAGADRV